ncbi:MAG: hypothetical protein HZY76_19355 [Anaerolineae bacterium]|nr:MAG: hypothetical protein HZY76_19355 [Anaerolineae bacterium]
MTPRFIHWRGDARHMPAVDNMALHHHRLPVGLGHRNGSQIPPDQLARDEFPAADLQGNRRLVLLRVGQCGIQRFA